MPVHSPSIDTDTATRVVVVARDERFRSRMRTRLSRLEEVYLSGEAADGSSAAIICALGHPDVVIMDAELPWLQGSDVVRRVRKAAPGTRIVACTASSADSSAAEVLTVGPAVVQGPHEDLAGMIRRRPTASFRPPG